MKNDLPGGIFCLSRNDFRRYASGLLIEDRLRSVEAHLASCEKCKLIAERTFPEDPEEVRKELIAELNALLSI